jgi:diguanylate cyclase (GGDEF)-like protein
MSLRRNFLRRPKAVPLIAVALAVAVSATTLQLQRQADDAHRAELQLQDVTLALTELQASPFRASPDTGGSPSLARGLINGEKSEITRILTELNHASPVSALTGLTPLLRENYQRIDRVFVLGATGVGFAGEAEGLAGENAAILDRESAVLRSGRLEYAARERRATNRAMVGAIGAIAFLLAAFGFYYLRAARSIAERKRALAVAREASLTDSLTGLGNRRALMEDLPATLRGSTPEERVLLVLFDLDGFKHYNDTFGHPAGDILLARLAGRLREATASIGSVYRAGGDEFCLLAKLGPRDNAAALAEAANAVMSEAGEGFEIGCSYGISVAPTEMSSAEAGLRLADERMYAAKAGRSSAERQSADVLLQVLTEQDAELGDHIHAVAALAGPTAERFGLSDPEVKRTRRAAELHDIGKSGIPDSILCKKGPLDDDEWAFMHRHTIIGERIVKAAPALAPAAELVRASHEHFDGNGYPDGLKGEEIPIGSRIITVCDSFNAMTSERPYSRPKSVAEALTELRRCAGTQFDPAVVDVFCSLIESPESEGESSAELVASP